MRLKGLTFLTQFPHSLPKLEEEWTRVAKMWMEDLLDSWSHGEVINGADHPIGKSL